MQLSLLRLCKATSDASSHVGEDISKINRYLCDMKLIEDNIARLNEICKKYKVKNLSVFGSLLTDRFNNESDVDLLVNFNEEDIPLLDFGDNFFGLQFELEEIFNRKIDLICDNAIKNSYFRKEVDSTKVRVYG